MRTILGFVAVTLGGTVVHRVRYQRSASIPASGPAIVLANHQSVTETLALAKLITGHHRFPHFLAKAEVFSWPVAGHVLRWAKQIPVVRRGSQAADALAAATAELGRGHLVAIYPEGRLTRRPDLLPGPGRTGAARLALANPGVPVVPVGQWGSRPGLRRHWWHRHTVTMVVGAPLRIQAPADPAAVDVAAAADVDVAAAADAPAVDAVTAAMMAAITDLTLQARADHEKLRRRASRRRA